MIEDLVTSQLGVLQAIIEQGLEKYMPDLGKVLSLSETRCPDNSYSKLKSSVEMDTPSLSSSDSDSIPLLVVTKSKVYNEKSEKLFEMRENLKREFQRDGHDKLSSKSEQMGVKKKKKIMTKMSKAIVKSVQSDPYCRSQSVTSNMSIISRNSGDYKDNGFDIVNTPSKRRTRKNSSPISDEIELSLICNEGLCKEENFNGNLAKYTAHMNIFHSKQKLYLCTICGNEFLSKDHLKVHSRSHDIRSVICGLCGNFQKNVRVYQTHIDKHLESTYNCVVCDLTFISRKELNTHTFNKHRDRRRIFLAKKEHNQQKLKFVRHSTSDMAPETNNTSTSKVFQSLTFNVKGAERKEFVDFRICEFNYLLNKAQTDSGNDFTTFDLSQDMLDNKEIQERSKEYESAAQNNFVWDKMQHSLQKVRNRLQSVTSETGRFSPSHRSLQDFSEDETPELDTCSVSGVSIASHISVESSNSEVARILGHHPPFSIETFRKNADDDFCDRNELDCLYDDPINEVDVETSYIDNKKT